MTTYYAIKAANIHLQPLKQCGRLFALASVLSFHPLANKMNELMMKLHN